MPVAPLGQARTTITHPLWAYAQQLFETAMPESHKLAALSVRVVLQLATHFTCFLSVLDFRHCTTSSHRLFCPVYSVILSSVARFQAVHS